MLGKKGPRSAPPPVSQVTLTAGLPNWQDGEHRDLSSRVLVVREMTTKMTCSAAIPQGMTPGGGVPGILATILPDGTAWHPRHGRRSDGH